METRVRIAVILAWMTALSAMLGSLYFSEIQGLQPCLLCWYQRIAMYPLVFMLGMIIWDENWNALKYAWPFCVGGALIAAWHVAIQYSPTLAAVIPCEKGYSCAVITWSLGPFTIPLLSLIAFVFVIACLIVTQRNRKEYH